MITEQRVCLDTIPMTTRVLRSGEGTPVLLLHGSPDSATEWRRVMERLGGSCACIAPDLPGLGARDDPYIPDRFSDAFDGAACESIDRAGHRAPISAADRVAEAIRATVAMQAKSA